MSMMSGVCHPNFLLLTKTLMEQPAKLQRVFCDWQVEPSICWQIPSRKDKSRHTRDSRVPALKRPRRASSIVAFAMDFLFLGHRVLLLLADKFSSFVFYEAAIDNIFQQRYPSTSRTHPLCLISLYCACIGAHTNRVHQIGREQSSP